MIKTKEFYDPATYTLTYVVWDPQSSDAVVIDPVLDYDPSSSRISDESVSAVSDFVKSKKLTLRYVLETHAHADHLSGSQILKQRFNGAKIAIGSRIKEVQNVFKGVFNLGEDFKTDGSQFDELLEDGSTLNAGTLKVKTLFTPGHTPACASYLIEDSVFTGDALFMPDYGTGRCDFPAGSSESLYRSIQDRLYTLPDSTRVFVGHDYQPGGREVRWESTIGEEKRKNIQLKAETPQQEFVEFRNKRDKSLKAPRLLLQSVQVNINAGCLPAPDEKGSRFLKIPVRGL